MKEAPKSIFPYIVSVGDAAFKNGYNGGKKQGAKEGPFLIFYFWRGKG